MGIIMETPQMVSFLEPERIVRYFGLEKGDHVADFGAGHGYFVIPMARVVGGDGRVYAIDIQKSVLEVIRTKAKLEHLLNIEPMWTDLEQVNGSHLKEKILDFVLIANILFQSESKDQILQEAHRVLREKGHLAIIEWDDTPTTIGPPIEVRIKKDYIKNLAVDSGFALDREFEAGSHHYGMLFKKQ